MKSKLNPISVGSFVIGGAILVVIALISFQSISFIHKPVRFISYFDESVQGLDVGSSVKLRGVAVGRVVAIKVQYDWSSSQSKIAVISELNKNAVADRYGNIIQISDATILNQLIKDGLRAKIDLVGITGLQFVQLDFLDPQKYSEDVITADSPYPIIPTVDSGMSKLTDNLVAIAENLRKVDLVEISNNLNALLASLNQETQDLNLKKLVSQSTTTAEAITATSQSITTTAKSIQRLSDFLEQNPSSLIFGRKPEATNKPETSGWIKNIVKKTRAIF